MLTDRAQLFHSESDHRLVPQQAVQQFDYRLVNVSRSSQADNCNSGRRQFALKSNYHKIPRCQNLEATRLFVGIVNEFTV